MIKVAITGGICSGKSTVCKFIEDKGYNVYYSDEIAKDLVNNNKSLKKAIIGEFGDKSFIDGKYDAKYMAKIVFSKDERLSKLNDIFRPFLDRKFNSICNDNIDENIIFYESALIFEHKKEGNFDKVVNVFADDVEILKRLKSRNNYSKKEIANRTKNFINPQYKNLKSDHVINTSLSGWEKQVDELLTKLL